MSKKTKSKELDNSAGSERRWMTPILDYLPDEFPRQVGIGALYAMRPNHDHLADEYIAYLLYKALRLAIPSEWKVKYAN